MASKALRTVITMVMLLADVVRCAEEILTPGVSVCSSSSGTCTPPTGTGTGSVIRLDNVTSTSAARPAQVSPDTWCHASSSALGYTVLKCAVRSEVGPGKKAAGGSRTCEVAVFSACRAPGVVLYPTRTCSARGASGRSCSEWNDKTTRTETMDEASSTVTFQGQCSTALSWTGQRALEVERYDNGEYKGTYRLSGATPWRLSLELVASCA
jgi:hypothetical protein